MTISCSIAHAVFITAREKSPGDSQSKSFPNHRKNGDGRSHVDTHGKKGEGAEAVLYCLHIQAWLGGAVIVYA